MSKYIRIAISGLLLTWIGWRTNWTDVAEKFATLRIEFWLAAVGLLVVAQVVSARRWQYFAQSLGFERTIAQYSAYYFIGMYFNLLLPTSVGGDVFRVWYLNANSGRKWAALASVFLERLNGLLVLIALACVGVLITPINLPWWIQASVWAIAAGATLGMMVLPFVQNWEILPVHRRQQLKTMMALLRVPRVVCLATIMSVLVQVVGVVGLWCIGMSLGLDVPLSYYCILGPMVSLLTLLPLSVNGMGVREAGTVLFLTPLGVDEGAALTLAFLWFAVQATVSLLGGGVYLFGAYPRADTTSNISTEGTNDHGSVDRDSDQGREGEFGAAA